MPNANTVRHFVTDGIYHIYNRGVEKRNIFLDDQDYAVFLHLLKYYLSPIDPDKIHPFLEFQNFKVIRPRPLKNIEKEIDLLAYCLMPNHFHILLKQTNIDGTTRLLRRISTTYAMYFNKRYNRVGYLFQGKYKAVLIQTDSYLLHVSRYIHLNPHDLQTLTGSDLVNYPYSSYKYYLGLAHTGWVKPDMILSYFDKSRLLPFLKKYPSYEEFVEKYPADSKEIIGGLTLE